MSATAPMIVAMMLAAASLAPVSAAGTADLGVGINGPSTATTGQQFTYNLAVSDSGPDASTGVMVTNTFSSSVTFYPSASAGPCSQTSSTVIACGPTSLAANTAVEWHFTVSTATTGTLVDTTTGTENESDPNPSNNTATWSTSVTQPTTADLGVSKSVSPGPYIVGQTFNYFLFFTNNGPADATNVTMTDQLPPQVQFVTAEAPCGATGNFVTCNLGTVRAHTVGDGIRVTVLAVDSGTAVNTVNISGDQQDPNPANNSYTLTIQISVAADLGVSKSVSSGPYIVGQPFNYFLFFSNAGPADATNVTMTDQLPPQVQFVTAEAPCGATGNFVTCNLGTVRAHTVSDGIRVTVLAVESGTAVNTVNISGDQQDPNPANNSFTLTIQIQPPTADLAVTKTGSPDPVVAGQKETYTITVTNNGPSTATGVVAQDSWSAASEIKGGIAFKSVSTTQGTCTQSGASISCDLGSLAKGSTATITLVLQPRSKGVLSDTATVSGNEFDPNSSNNSSTVLTTVG